MQRNKRNGVCNPVPNVFVMSEPSDYTKRFGRGNTSRPAVDVPGYATLSRQI